MPHAGLVQDSHHANVDDQSNASRDEHGFAWWVKTWQRLGLHKLCRRTIHALRTIDIGLCDEAVHSSDEQDASEEPNHLDA